MGKEDAFELALEMVPPESLLKERNLEYRRCRYEVRVGVHPQGGGIQLLEENFWLLKTPLENAIYLIEEPENGIHPRAIEGVFQSLSSVYEGQVLLATHSALLVGLAKPEQILCFARSRVLQATDIVRGDEHPKLQAWKGEINLGELYAAGVLTGKSAPGRQTLSAQREAGIAPGEKPDPPILCAVLETGL